MEETTLKQYKGTKTVKAEPMNESVAVEKGFARANKDVHERREGYHVQVHQPRWQYIRFLVPKRCVREVVQDSRRLQGPSGNRVQRVENTLAETP